LFSNKQRAFFDVFSILIKAAIGSIRILADLEIARKMAASIDPETLPE
jgi:hypothetical protein